MINHEFPTIIKHDAVDLPPLVGFAPNGAANRIAFFTVNDHLRPMEIDVAENAMIPTAKIIGRVPSTHFPSNCCGRLLDSLNTGGY